MITETVFPTWIDDSLELCSMGTYGNATYQQMAEGRAASVNAFRFGFAIFYMKEGVGWASAYGSGWGDSYNGDDGGGGVSPRNS